MFDDKYVGWLIDIRRDDGMGVGVWFDNEADAIAHENKLWERGYIEGQSMPDADAKILRRYSIAKCETARFELSFEAYARGQVIEGDPPYVATYSWKDFEEYLEHKEWNDKREGGE